MPSTHDLDRLLHAHGGAMHSADLRARGYSSHVMRVAVGEGRVSRVRRSWLVAPACDSELRAAASISGRLTCVTAAARRKLWVPEGRSLHLAVPLSASRLATDGMVLHRARGPAPFPKHALVDPIVNVLFHVARCLPPRDALAVWESAIRTRAVDVDILARVVWRSTAAARLISFASVLSDSGLETWFIDLMRAIGVSVRQQVVIDGHPVDGVVGERLVVQIDGFAHHQGRDRRRDLRADARLVLRGYTVLRFDFAQLLLSPDEVTATIADAIAQNLHRR